MNTNLKGDAMRAFRCKSDFTLFAESLDDACDQISSHFFEISEAYREDRNLESEVIVGMEGEVSVMPIQDKEYH